MTLREAVAQNAVSVATALKPAKGHAPSDRGSGTRSGEIAELRSVPSRFLRWLLPPVYYWLNLSDHGTPAKPSHSKILSSVAFVFGVHQLIVWGPVVRKLCALGAPGCTMVLVFYLGFSGLVFGMAFGLPGFKAWSKSRGAGANEALGQIGVAAVQTSAEIAARRAQGGGDFEVTV